MKKNNKNKKLKPLIVGGPSVSTVSLPKIPKTKRKKFDRDEAQRKILDEFWNENIKKQMRILQPQLFDDLYFTLRNLLHTIKYQAGHITRLAEELNEQGEDDNITTVADQIETVADMALGKLEVIAV